jgi:MFS family permease
MTRLLPKRVFYGWWMVAAAFGVQLLTGGVLMQSYGAYVAVLRDDKGWSKTALAGAFSFTQFIGGVIGPFQGQVMDRVGPRASMRFGFIVLGVGLMLISRVDTLLQYYGAFVLIAIGVSCSAFFPLTVALVNWFERRRARVLATMSLGFAVGGLLVPLVALSLDHFGWRTTFFASGVVVIVAGLPLAQVMRHKPEQYGETIDGVPAPPPHIANTPAVHINRDSRDFTLAEAVRTPAFWLISLGHGSALLVVGAVSVHVISHLKEDLGYSVSSASLVVTLMTVFQVVGMLVGGALGDHIEQREIAAICMFLHMIGLLLVAFATNLLMVVAFAALHGMAWGARGPLMQAIRADYFGRSSFGAIMGASTTIFMLGQIGGPLLAGFLADSTGSYEIGFTVLAILAGLGSGFFIFAKRPSPPERVYVPTQVAEPIS